MKWLIFVLLAGFFMPAAVQAQAPSDESEATVDAPDDTPSPPEEEAQADEVSDLAGEDIASKRKRKTRECIRGQVDAGGMCCWPGQTLWVGDCIGKAQCPDGTQARDRGGVTTTCEIDDPLAWHQELCETGSRLDCLHVAKLQWTGPKRLRNLREAMQRLEDLCELDDQRACGSLRKFYRDGILVNQDRDAAKSYAAKACSLGDASSCAFIVPEGDGTPGDRHKKRLLHLQELCKRDGMFCTVRTMVLYSRAESVGERAEAASLLDEQCERGNWLSCTFRDDLRWQGEPEERDVEGVIRTYEEGCTKGSAYLCKKLADVYLEGPDDVRDTERALEFLERACLGHINSSCYILGGHYYQGRGVDSDHQRAAQIFQASCERGHDESCSNLASMYLNGDGVEHDMAKGMELLAYTCDAGHNYDCNALARLYRDVEGFQNDSEARRLHDRACKGRIGDSCLRLVTFREKGIGGEKDLVGAREILFEGCDQKHPVACNDLGYHFETYYADAPGKDLARVYYEQSCDLGSALGCSNAGRLLESDHFNDHPRALVYFELACQGGRGRTCSKLGDIFSNGTGVDIDRKRARELYVQACRLGYSVGCARIGQMYAYGKGVRRDDARARRFLKRACDDDIFWACKLEGDLHRSGRGGAKDLNEARSLYRKACDGGDREGCDRIGR